MTSSPEMQHLHWIRVTVPIASFTIPFAREFAETYPFPPPATVYGMLLSYMGETDRSMYLGTKLVIIVVGTPEPSVVLRKIRRVKRSDLNDKENSKPDFQTLLSGLEFFVGIDDSTAKDVSLWASFKKSYSESTGYSRFGGLSCGESHNLVDEISLATIDEMIHRTIQEDLHVLQPAEDGDWALPIWVDHVGSSGTKWARASFLPALDLSPSTNIQLFPIMDEANQ